MNDRGKEKLGWTVGMLGSTAWMFLVAAWRSWRANGVSGPSRWQRACASSTW